MCLIMAHDFLARKIIKSIMNTLHDKVGSILWSHKLTTFGNERYIILFPTLLEYRVCLLANNLQ